jgi:DNA-binding NarL/FixJ family response regulator
MGRENPIPDRHRRRQDGAMARTVLVVDDHAAFRGRARAMLEADGFVVVGEVGDCDAAVAAAERLHPDIALVDIQLPDCDGFQVAERLRRAAAARWIVLISVRDRADFGSRIERSWADAFIAKVELSGERLTAVLD